jgi:hypothetical protein
VSDCSTMSCTIVSMYMLCTRVLASFPTLKSSSCRVEAGNEVEMTTFDVEPKGPVWSFERNMRF